MTHDGKFLFQLYLSRQLAQLHPELTMPMFSEICHRLQTARPSRIKCLLYYLLPWLYNMELVDGAATAAANTAAAVSSQDAAATAVPASATAKAEFIFGTLF